VACSVLRMFHKIDKTKIFNYQKASTIEGLKFRFIYFYENQFTKPTIIFAKRNNYRQKRELFADCYPYCEHDRNLQL
jgi:hypothetical protein